MMDGKHLYFLQLVCYDEERQTSLLPTAGLLRRRTANIFTSYSWSITTKNGKHIYFLQLVCYDEERQTSLLPTAGLAVTTKNGKHLYFLQLVCYDEERQTSLLPTAGLLRRRTANISTSYRWSVTTKNGKHLYFLQLVCCDCRAEEEGPWLPVIWTAGSFRLGPVTTNRGRGRGGWAGAMGHVLWMAAFLILSSINSQLSWLRGWRKIRMSLRHRERKGWWEGGVGERGGNGSGRKGAESAVQTKARRHTYTHTHTDVRTRAHTHTHTHTHTYTRTRTHTHLSLIHISEPTRQS